MKKFLQLTLSLLLLFVANPANAWKFTVNSPAEGTVTELYQIVLNEPAGTMWVDEMSAMPCILKCSDGTEYTYNMQDQFNTTVAGTPVGSAEIVAPGTYTLTIPAGTFHISGVDNEEQTFTWTIGGGSGNEEQKSPYTLTYDKSTEFLKLAVEGCTSYETTYSGGATLEGYDGLFSFNPWDSDYDLVVDCIGAYISLPDGDYTLKVQAGTYKFDGAENEAIEIPFTVGESTQGGGGGTANFDGEKWQETIFKSGETSVTVPVRFDTEGMTLTTEGREFMGQTIDVAYNTYAENEIDWNNGTKIIITAKDNISGIVMKGNFLQFASADKGSYINGAWSGALMKGETLTLTAIDGITVKEITILYNGDEYENEGGESQEGVITIQYPTPNMAWATFNNGSKLATFTTNKEYAQVVIDVKDTEPGYDNGNYDFPTRMVDNNGEKSDNLHVGENTITALTPDAKPWNFFKGHTYKMIIRGYVNMWDQQDAYDAIAEVTFIGDGTPAAAISDITLDKVFPANGTALPEGPRTVNLTFSAPVKTLKAVQPKGMEGSVNYTCTKVDEAGLIWNVDLGSLNVDSEQGDESTISLEISGTDMNDAVLDLGNNAARALQLQYTISKKATEPEDEVDVQIVPSFLDGEEEIALNDHSAVSVAKADAIKVGFGDNAAKIKYATYSINELVEEEFMGQTDIVEVEIASGNLNINAFGYAQFEQTLQFPAGHKYNVKIKAWDSENIFNEDLSIKEPIATFECEFNGSDEEQGGEGTDVTITSAFLAGEEEITLNNHSSVSVETADAIKAYFGDNAGKIKYATYSINELVEEEFMGQTDIVEIEIASGNLNLNVFGYAQFEQTLQFPAGHKYNVKIKAWDSEDIFNADLTIKDPIATFECEFNGANEEQGGEGTDVTITSAFLAGEEEITLNNHSSVSVETADAIKAYFGDNAGKIKYATYSINELVEEEFMGQTDIVEIEVVSGALNLNVFGYAQFEETLKFPAGHKYNVKIKAWDSEDIFNADFTVKDPIATFECEFNGAYEEPVEGIMLVIKNKKGEIIYKVKADENIQLEWIDASELDGSVFDHK